MTGLLFGVTPTDAPTYLVVSAVLIAAAIAYFGARAPLSIAASAVLGRIGSPAEL